MIEVDPDLLFGFTVDSDPQIRVFRVLPASGKGHMPGPRVLRMMRAVDEEQVQVILLRLQQQAYRSPCGRLNRGLDRPVIGEHMADSSDFSVYHTISSTMKEILYVISTSQGILLAA